MIERIYEKIIYEKSYMKKSIMGTLKNKRITKHFINTPNF